VIATLRFQGPLVSQKLAIADLMNEYAQADPTFVTKTRVYLQFFYSLHPLTFDRPSVASMTLIVESEATASVDGEVC
jgi:hypothetical protein